MSSSEELKALGNSAFAAKNYSQAIDYFTQAIEASPTPNHVLFLNRSAAYASNKDYQKALEDAEKCVNIKPDWAKGYSRLGAAHVGLGDSTKAVEAYEKCLSIDPQNKAGKDGLEQAKALQSQPSPFSGGLPFSDPNLVGKLKAHPKTAAFMNDPEFVKKITNPNLMQNPQEMLLDPRMMTAMGVILGIDLDAAANPAQEEPKKEEPKKEEPKKEETKKEAPKKEEAQPIEVEPTPKEEADKIKAQANALYKKRQFDEAIELYNKAYETYEDITYLNNRAAAEFEKGEYDTCIETCNLAVEKGREVRADYKIIAKSFARIGAAYQKKDDLKNAIAFYDKSLTEHRTGDVLTKLRTAEKLLKKKESEAYINPEKAEEARKEGGEYFTKGDWPNAVKSYTEMIKRAPHDARGYLNRAAAYIKLMSFPDAVKDCDTAIEKDPHFVKAYIRKASAQLTMREFKPCLDTLEVARKVDNEHNGGKSAYEINQLEAKAMSQRFAPLDGETQDQTRERLARDPEVQEVLLDPVMQNILLQASNDPGALQEHMKNPEVLKKVRLLAAAGVIRMG